MTQTKHYVQEVYKKAPSVTALHQTLHITTLHKEPHVSAYNKSNTLNNATQKYY